MTVGDTLQKQDNIAWGRQRTIDNERHEEDTHAA